MIRTLASDKVESEEQVWGCHPTSIHRQYHVMPTPLHMSMYIIYTQALKIKDPLVYQ